MTRTWTEGERDRLQTLWEEVGGRTRRIARLMGKTPGQISGQSRRMGLQFHGGRTRILSVASPSAKGGHTVFPGSVISADSSAAKGIPILKTGDNQRKLGSHVRKGAWKGMPIFSLTLEERATCPRTCKQWTSCYGNQMGMAKRYAHGPELEDQIIAELAQLQARYPKGFVVRLHILGDFYSKRYVSLWRCALEAFPALRVFGYTARLPDSPIGAAIGKIRDAHWDRFAIRTSDGTAGPRTAVMAKHPIGRQSDTTVCPAQTGKTKNCGTCALCWSPAARERTIIFLQH